MRDERANDEIDLVDLWLILLRHWKVLALVLVAGTVLGVAYALVKPEVYSYRTLIEIGTHIVNDDQQLIESPVSLSAKVSEGYRTMVLRAFYDHYPDIKRVFEVNVSVPKDAELVVLEDEAPREYGTYVQEIHEQLVQLVLKDHARIVSLIRNDLQNELQNTRNHLTRLKEEAQLLNVDLERLEERHQNKVAIVEQSIKLAKVELGRLEQTEKIVTEQIANLERLIDQAQQNRTDAMQEAGNASGAMTLMLISDELQRNQVLLANLRERQAVEIPNQRSASQQRIEELEKEKIILSNALASERDRFAQQIADQGREQEQIIGEIETLELRLENLRDTRTIAVAAESIRPAGPGKALIVAVALLLSGFVGLVAVFLVHMSEVARSRQG